MKSKLVYLFEGERGLYCKDSGRYYFPERVGFKDAKSGFAFVEVSKELETFGLLKGKMVSNSKVDLNECGCLLYNMGGSYWNVAIVNGVEIAWVYSGYSLVVYVDGVMYTQWGNCEYDIYKELESLDNVSVYSFGYYVRDMVTGLETKADVSNARECKDWSFGGKDELYIFGGKIMMFDPMSGSMTNYGVMYGGVYKELGCVETIDMWNFLCKEYEKDMMRVC